MSRIPAACAVVAFAASTALAGTRAQPATSPSTLSLEAAFERVEHRHPDLRVFVYTERTLIAEREQAQQRSPSSVGIDVENVLGTGPYGGIDAAEATLTLASVLERGGKRAARQAVADSRIDAMAAQREARRLDVLAEVARRYLDLAAAQAEADIADDEIAQRERTVAAAKRRVDAGASPQSVWLSAQAALAHARLARERAVAAGEAAWRRLALLWDETEPSAMPNVIGDVLSLPIVQDFDALQTLIESTPALRAFADERRIREAKLELARSARVADVDWQVGVRRFQAERDWALTAGVSIPLGTARRAGPGVRAAEAELAALDLEREGSELALYATLAEAYGRYRAAMIEVERFGSDVLPAMARAEAAAERAFRAGAASYLEWAQLQNDRTASRRQQLAAALAGQRALIEIQRLTAEPFVLAPAASTTRESLP